ncbi:MAG: hypothetical protein JWL63_1002 [Rhodocyclales bacterium]|nr:hypothetical protein [Rhodocyclales bacterium]
MNMKKSVLAALLSGLVFPGTGYFVLKRTMRGLVVVAIAVAGLIYLSNAAIQQAAGVMEKISAGEVPLDASGIEKLVAATPTGADPVLLNLATLAMVGCWLFSIVDGYRIGRDEDRKAAGALSK